MNLNAIKEIIQNGGAEILPSRAVSGRRGHADSNARLTMSVPDEVIKRLNNQRPTEQDVFVVVRIPYLTARAKESGLILPGVPGGKR